MICPVCSGTGSYFEYGTVQCHLCHGSGRVQGTTEQEKQMQDITDREREEEIQRALDRIDKKKKKNDDD